MSSGLSNARHKLRAHLQRAVADRVPQRAPQLHCDVRSPPCHPERSEGAHPDVRTAASDNGVARDACQPVTVGGERDAAHLPSVTLQPERRLRMGQEQPCAGALRCPRPPASFGIDVRRPRSAWRSAPLGRRGSSPLSRGAVSALISRHHAGPHPRGGSESPHRGLPVVVAHPRQVRVSDRAVGQLAKTDRIDAALHALFGSACARAGSPARCRRPGSEALLSRRRQLLERLTAERNRLVRARRGCTGGQVPPLCHRVKGRAYGDDGLSGVTTTVPLIPG